MPKVKSPKSGTKITKNQRIVLLAFVIYLVLFLIDHIWQRILKNEPTAFSYLVLDLTVILVCGTLIWFVLSQGKGLYRELRKYVQDLNPLTITMFGWIVALVFILISIKNLEFFLTFSAITFSVAGFSFTAGSFFKGKKPFGDRFFRVSTIFTVAGFLSLLFYMFYDIIANMKPDNVVIFHYYFNTVNLNMADIAGSVLVLFVLALGYLFWIAFLQLIKLLIYVPNK